jgi:hypothetical protein
MGGKRGRWERGRGGGGEGGRKGHKEVPRVALRSAANALTYRSFHQGFLMIFVSFFCGVFKSGVRASLKKII